METVSEANDHKMPLDSIRDCIDARCPMPDANVYSAGRTCVSSSSTSIYMPDAEATASPAHPPLGPPNRAPHQIGTAPALAYQARA
jgi:hypothetical protein